MCSIRIKMGETWTAPNPDSQDSSREKPKDPEGIWRPETLSEVLNPPPCSRRALQPTVTGARLALPPTSLSLSG